MLTSARFVLAVAGVIALLWTGTFNLTVAAVILLAAVVTDWLDGVLARKLKQQSPLGAFMDPLADKMIVIPYMIILAAWGIFPLWVVIFLVMRDLFHDGVRSFAASKRVVFGANFPSKIKTALQMTALLVAMGVFCVQEFNGGIAPYQMELFIVAVGLLVASLISGIIGTGQLLHAARPVFLSRT